MGCPMSDLHVHSAVQQCIDAWLEEFGIEAPLKVFLGQREACQNLTETLASGKTLTEDQFRQLLSIVSSHINHLTYQCVPPYMEPQLPLLDLPGRIQSATAILKALEPLLGKHAAEMDRWRSAIEQARRLRFRWSYGEPLDYEVLWAERELHKGSVVRALVARSIPVPFGPTSWSEREGPAHPGRIFVRLGQVAPATVLLLIEQDRPHFARLLRIFALHQGEKRLLQEIDDEVLWYCQGLDQSLFAEELKGTHFALRATPARNSVDIADLGSPLGVYLQIPLREREMGA